MKSKIENKVYKARCINCNACVKFKRSEAEFISDERDGDCLAVNCPSCKAPVYVRARVTGSGS